MIIPRIRVHIFFVFFAVFSYVKRVADAKKLAAAHHVGEENADADGWFTPLPPESYARVRFGDGSNATASNISSVRRRLQDEDDDTYIDTSYIVEVAEDTWDDSSTSGLWHVELKEQRDIEFNSTKIRTSDFVSVGCAEPVSTPTSFLNWFGFGHALANSCVVNDYDFSSRLYCTEKCENSLDFGLHGAKIAIVDGPRCICCSSDEVLDLLQMVQPADCDYDCTSDPVQDLDPDLPDVRHTKFISIYFFVIEIFFELKCFFNFCFRISIVCEF